MRRNKHLSVTKRIGFARKALSHSTTTIEREILVQTAAPIQPIANNAVRLVFEYPLSDS